VVVEEVEVEAWLMPAAEAEVFGANHHLVLFGDLAPEQPLPATMLDAQQHRRIGVVKP
jgi:hypothetical protein